MPLILVNARRLSNNFRQYEHSYIPEHQPSGGGFSITKISLDGIFEQHQLVRNWWTKTNQSLPLVRYTGMKIKLYRSDTQDYVLNYHTCFPMLATADLYTSAQPSLQLMNPKAVIVPSKRTQPKGKSYKTIRIQPPAQLSNKWYFSKDLAKTGLALLSCTACSLDNYYISHYNESNNITFTSLNPLFFTLHNFQETGAHGYVPYEQGTTTKTLWSTRQTGNLTSIPFNTLTYLGNSTYRQPGQPINNTNWDTYFAKTNYKNWGNIFYKGHLVDGDERILVSTQSWPTLESNYKNKMTDTLKEGFFTEISQEMLIKCRYAPDRDTGKDNSIYILSNVRETKDWGPPTNEQLRIWGFPLWLAAFGWLDWQKKLNIAIHMERNWIVVMTSSNIEPKLPYYIPLDKDFLDNRSAYEQHEDTVNDSDQTKWFPQITYQHQTLEEITQTGPGIAKLGSYKSAECKMKYSLYFKFGGCPPKMERITDPTEQEIYPIPNNNNEMYSLQNPNTPPENFLYTFDVRQDILTKKAAKRMQTDWETEKTLFTDAGKLEPSTALQAYQSETPSPGETDSEKEEENLLQQLQHQRRKRRKLQHKLLQLMQQT